MNNRIDLNADLGESVNGRIVGDDAGVMPWISSANIACGFHAGDPTIMRGTLIACRKHGVAAGAHPSFDDIAGFGRREMPIAPDVVYVQTLYQIGALAGIARSVGIGLTHVKPHGALYNQAARDRTLADAIALAVRDVDPDLILFGLAGSALIGAGRALGLAVRREAFCDRRYRADGALVPRAQVGAVLESIDEAVAQAVSIACEGTVRTDDGSALRIEADTLCIHGDRADAAALARRVHEALHNAGIQVSQEEEN